MCLDLGRDFYCAYRGKWVARSEFNSDIPARHEPKNSVPYVAAPMGECPCIKCDATDKSRCNESCSVPRKLRIEYYEQQSRIVDSYGRIIAGRIADAKSRCDHCLAQYKVHGKLR